MATDLNTIINWFQTGAYPTGPQFAAAWSSFYHKDDTIPISAIEGLSTQLGSYVEISVLDNHIKDTNAHGGTMARIDGSNLSGANQEAWRTLLGINEVAYVQPGEQALVYSQKQVDDLLAGYNLQSSNNTIKIIPGSEPDLVSNIGIGEEEFIGETNFKLSEFPLDIIGVYNDGIRLLANDWELKRPQEIIIYKGEVGVVSVVYTKIIEP